MLGLAYFTLSVSFISVLIFIYYHFSASHTSTEKSCPESYPIIGNLPGLLRNRHRFHDWITDMLCKTPSATLQVNTFLNLSHGICTANPINVEHLLVSNFPNYIKGSRFHTVLYELLGHGIFNVDGHLWSAQRKIASHEFNTRSLKHFISDVVKTEISNSFMPYLNRACDQDSVFDLQEVLQELTFTNVCKVAFGVDPAASTSALRFAKAFDDAVENCFQRFISPLPITWKIKRLMNMGSEKEFKDAICIINEFAMRVIKAKQEDQQLRNGEKEGKNQDLLSRFMSSDLEFRDQDQKMFFLRDIIISFVLAGKDTTSTALTWFFWLIAGNPRCATMIHNELSSFDAAVTHPEPDTAAELKSGFGYDELKRLHYLQAALSESMRLFPPVPINSKLTVNDDVLPDGTRVRKGWFADYSAYAMGRMEKIWGQDCSEFKPERWLNDDGVFQPSDQFRFPVFHCGPRMCLGKEMAYIQMKAIVTAVMFEFDVLPVDGGASATKIMVNPPYMLTLLLKMRGGLPVRLKRRSRREPQPDVKN